MAIGKYHEIVVGERDVGFLLKRMQPASLDSLISRKEVFLSSMRSSGKLDYRRYTETPLRYAGGKTLAVGYVAELIPDDVTRLASPFFGGGSVEIACSNELGIEVFGYDILDVLCTYWKVQLHKPEALYQRLAKIVPNRESFKEVKEIMWRYWKEGIRDLHYLDVAAYYYFNVNTSYGPHFLGWPSDVYLEPNRYAKMISKSRSFRAPTLSVECMDFEKSLQKHTSDFLYCDPPYYLDDGKTFVGLYPHRNFPIHHQGFKHETLRDLLHAHKDRFILSYNDCDVIRDWYSDFNIIERKWQYTFGQGDTRIGKNRSELNGGSHVKKSHEMLIWNF